MLTVAATAVVASRLAVRLSLAGRPENPLLPLVPDGLCHAVMLGEEVTVCGRPTTGLAMFPGLFFTDATFLLRCDDCGQRLGSVR